MSKKRKKRRIDNDWMTFSVTATPGATRYTIYGIAPIPVRLETDNMPSRIEATHNGYNLHGVRA